MTASHTANFIRVAPITSRTKSAADHSFLPNSKGASRAPFLFMLVVFIPPYLTVSSLGLDPRAFDWSRRGGSGPRVKPEGTDRGCGTSHKVARTLATQSRSLRP